MGYSTTFKGQIDLDQPLTSERLAYLKAFSGTCRMKRDEEETERLSDPIREAVRLPVGADGGNYVGEYMQKCTELGIPYGTEPPAGQPNFYCQWIPTDDGKALVWDRGEKFYDYVEWLEYLIAHFLKPWGYVLNGSIEWIGDDPNDRGRILVKNNAVKVQRARITYR